jgi:hypothetical protein
MSLRAAHLTTSHPAPSPTDRVGRVALAVAPLLYLAVDTLYAARGWDDAAAGALHVVGAIVYVLALLHVASWAGGRLAALAVVTAVVGGVGNAAYGFEAIHSSLGAVALVDAPGTAAAIIKPIGLVCPVAFLVAAAVLARVGHRVSAVLVAVAALVWPVAHVGDIAALAVAVNVLLAAGLVPLAWSRPPQPHPDTIDGPDSD